MISYSLCCERGHHFDSWFQDSAAYEKQVKRGLVSCPVCESTKIEKAIMAPRIARKRRGEAPAPPSETPAEAPATTPAAVQSAPMPLMSAAERELRSKIKELHEHIAKNADHVGNKFPDEARKMHYGESKPRPIYGEASPKEAKELIEEGIDITPLPVLPDDRN
jgi:hypothetical protein